MRWRKPADIIYRAGREGRKGAGLNLGGGEGGGTGQGEGGGWTWGTI
jgi:hypothetical protein